MLAQVDCWVAAAQVSSLPVLDAIRWVAFGGQAPWPLVTAGAPERIWHTWLAIQAPCPQQCSF